MFHWFFLSLSFLFDFFRHAFDTVQHPFGFVALICVELPDELPGKSRIIQLIQAESRSRIQIIRFKVLLNRDDLSQFRRGIRRFFPEHELPHPMKLPLLLKNDLSPEEIVFYSRRLRNYPELRIVPVIRRVVVGTPEIQSQIGKTALNDAGEAVGVSGLEREYDLELSGTSGRMTVMLDRNGNWCYDTLRITRQAKNGEDIRADFELPPETDASKELPEDEKD